MYVYGTTNAPTQYNRHIDTAQQMYRYSTANVQAQCNNARCSTTKCTSAVQPTYRCSSLEEGVVQLRLQRSKHTHRAYLEPTCVDNTTASVMPTSGNSRTPYTNNPFILIMNSSSGIESAITIRRSLGHSSTCSASKHICDMEQT